VLSTSGLKSRTSYPWTEMISKKSDQRTETMTDDLVGRSSHEVCGQHPTLAPLQPTDCLLSPPIQSSFSPLHVTPFIDQVEAMGRTNRGRQNVAAAMGTTAEGPPTGREMIHAHYDTPSPHCLTISSSPPCAGSARQTLPGSTLKTYKEAALKAFEEKHERSTRGNFPPTPLS